MAYHSKKSGVYHDDPNCTLGNKIEKKNRRNGTGGNRRCKRCKNRRWLIIPGENRDGK